MTLHLCGRPAARDMIFSLSPETDLSPSTPPRTAGGYHCRRRCTANIAGATTYRPSQNRGLRPRRMISKCPNPAGPMNDARDAALVLGLTVRRDDGSRRLASTFLADPRLRKRSSRSWIGYSQIRHVKNDRCFMCTTGTGEICVQGLVEVAARASEQWIPASFSFSKTTGRS